MVFGFRVEVKLFKDSGVWDSSIGIASGAVVDIMLPFRKPKACRPVQAFWAYCGTRITHLSPKP